MYSINLEALSHTFKGVTIEYVDIVNYEIARENICSYIFYLSRMIKNCESNKSYSINQKIENLIYIRDNLQIEDFDSIKKVFNHIIPEYKLQKRMISDWWIIFN